LSTSRELDIANASLTPATYSFAEVLLQSMVVLVPWQSNWPRGVIFVVMGIGDSIYRINIVRVRSGLHLRAVKTKMDFPQRYSDRCQRHLDLQRRGIDRRRGFRPFRHSGLNHALPSLRNLPNLGGTPGFN
jgi:hypothetical protein